MSDIFEKAKKGLFRESFQDYRDLGIVGYGSFLYMNTGESNVQRLRTFSKISMRSIITPQYFEINGVKEALAIRGFAIDNGAWLCYKKDEPFPTEKFFKLCSEFGVAADWVAIPDVVGNGAKTLSKLDFWIKEIKARTQAPLLLVWQDGMTLKDIEPYLQDGIGVFIGGTTEGKLSNMKWISKACYEHKVWCHLGRVNSAKRVKSATSVWIDSFDGSGFSQFPHMTQYIKNIIDENSRQLRFFKRNNPIRSKGKKWIKTFDDRVDLLNVDKQKLLKFYQDSLKVDTAWVSLPKGYKKSLFPILNGSDRI